MDHETRTRWTGTIVAGFAAIAFLCLPAPLFGEDNRPGSPPGKLIMHEWGTFTSFAGSDGVNLEFRPYVKNDSPWEAATDLPRFVITMLPTLAKPTYYARQRMETPVTYFYTDEPRVVNVRVDLPQGMLTEWYPVVKAFDAGQKTDQRPQGNAYLDWGAVWLTPPEQFADIRVRGPKGQVEPASLPPVGEDEHYGRARETDSAVVEVVNGLGSHFEKFLFYRGLGNFELPIQLTAQGDDRFEVSNSGEDASGALLLVRIVDGHVRFTRHDPVGPHSAVEIALPSDESTADKLGEAVADELVSAGLYKKEAWAMVNTWRSSWFGEEGTRLMYLVPGQLTDKLLPLTIHPTPDESVRVLVGRLETLTPEDCRRIVRTLAGSDPGEEPTAEAVKEELASLGRFAEPALQFVIGQTSDPTARGRLEAVLADLRGK